MIDVKELNSDEKAFRNEVLAEVYKPGGAWAKDKTENMRTKRETEKRVLQKVFSIAQGNPLGYITAEELAVILHDPNF